jgi:AcrR family transcriptional regulator
MESARPKQVRMPASERRGVIVQAAARLFGERGYSGTRLDDVAAAAGVTKPVLYRHFDSKKVLYMALLARHEADLPRFFEGVAPAGAGPESLVRAILEVWLDYVRANSHAWLMLFRDSSGDEEIQAFRARVSRRAREVMAAFIAEAGGERIPAEQVEPTAELLRSGLASLALWWIDHPDVPKSVLVEVAVRPTAAILSGLRSS